MAKTMQKVVVQELPLEALTVKIVLSRPLRFRLWLATKLISIATKLVNGQTDVTLR